jgi:AcrR family transcriptional regulator
VSTSKLHKAEKPNYHHGNLRSALIQTALEMLDEQADADLGLRQVAARAGVSNGAPYRHFEDRDALLAAVAAVGFERLFAVTTEARLGQTRPQDQLTSMAEAYLVFGAQHKGLYRLMFTQNLLAKRNEEELATRSRQAFGALEETTRLCLREKQDQARLVATSIWASLHGATMLRHAHLIPAGGPVDDAQAATIAKAISRLIVKALTIT